MNYRILPSNHPDLTEPDLIAAQAQSEAYFQTVGDASQIEIGLESRRWVVDHIPECWRIILCGADVIGHSFVLPCAYELMHAFVGAEISEAGLFAAVQRRPADYTCLYFCSACVAEAHRRRGLAGRAFLDTAQEIMRTKNPRPQLCYWAYSSLGSALAEKLGALAQAQSLVLHVRRE